MIRSSIINQRASVSMAKLLPSTRLICSMAVLITTILIPLNHWQLIAGLCVLVVGWTLWCGVPRADLSRFMILAVCVFALVLMLIPLAYYANGISRYQALSTAIKILIRSSLSISVCFGAHNILKLSELEEALYSLPLSTTVCTLILQTFHQSALLKNESSRMLDAYRLRGITTAGLCLRMRCLCAFPVLWLLRLAQRADRVGNAMELRGYTGAICPITNSRTTLPDLLARTCAFIILSAAITLKILLKY